MLVHTYDNECTCSACALIWNNEGHMNNKWCHI